jgi:hypothetical protein
MSFSHRTAIATVWFAILVPFLAAVFVASLRVAAVDLHAAPAVIGAAGIVFLAGSLVRSPQGIHLAALAVASLALGILSGLDALGGALTGAFLFGVGAGARVGIRAMAASMVDPGTPKRSSVALWVVGLVVVFVQLGRLAVFLADHSFTAGALLPGLEELERHSCLTSYVHGVQLSELGLDPYDPRYDTLSQGIDAVLPDTAAHMAPFTLDLFGYTPAFLLLPRAMMVVSRDFLWIRSAFAALSLLVWGLSLWWTARAVDPRAGRRLLWLAPLGTAMVPIYICLQFGNANLLLSSLLAIAALNVLHGRPGWVGALISFATLTRYTPALLAILVFLQRRWKVVLSGVVATAVLVGGSVVVLGTSPWHFFIETNVPLMTSGNVMSFVDRDALVVAQNVSPFSLPLKLRELGLAEWGLDEAQRVSKGFWLLLFGLTAWTARRRGDARHFILVWSAIAMLGAIQSNFAGQHVMVGMIYLMMVLATEVRTVGATVLFAVGWLLFTLFPAAPSQPTFMLGFGLLQGVIVVGFLVWLLLRKPRVDALDPVE